jgi:hypothetical protein
MDKFQDLAFWVDAPANSLFAGASFLRPSTQELEYLPVIRVMLRRNNGALRA